MKILDWICEKELAGYEYRLLKLESMGAPQVMIDRQKELCEELRNRTIKVGGDSDLLNNEVESFEVKTGREGKQYVEFNNSIKYFPQAKYGRFITA